MNADTGNKLFGNIDWARWEYLIAKRNMLDSQRLKIIKLSRGNMKF